MNKKIKVIDLIDKKYHNLELPKHIRINKLEYFYNENRKTYDSEYGEQMSFDFTDNVLNREVEILEDNTEEIEEIGEFVDLIGMDENEEEKKAIEIIKFLQHKCIQENGIGMMTIYRVDEIANAIETILTLIEKQQKEVEELNKKIQRIYDTQRMIDISDINRSHISFN